MFESSKFTIDALLGWAREHLQTLVVLHRGDQNRGLILLCQELKQQPDSPQIPLQSSWTSDLALPSLRCRLWVQQTDRRGLKVFCRRFESDVAAQDAQAFLDRERHRDEDLWILVHEASDGVLPPVLQEALD